MTSSGKNFAPITSSSSNLSSLAKAGTEAQQRDQTEDPLHRLVQCDPPDASDGALHHRRAVPDAKNEIFWPYRQRKCRSLHPRNDPRPLQPRLHRRRLSQSDPATKTSIPKSKAPLPSWTRSSARCATSAPRCSFLQEPRPICIFILLHTIRSASSSKAI